MWLLDGKRQVLLQDRMLAGREYEVDQTVTVITEVDGLLSNAVP